MRRACVHGRASGVLAGAGCSGGSSPANRTASTTTRAPAPPSTTRQIEAPRPAEPPVTLDCRDVIGSTVTPGPGWSVVFGRVALPTEDSLQVRTTGEATANARLFSKAGLLIAPGASFDLIVPAAWTARFTIGWGSPGKRTSLVRVRGCPATDAAGRWLAFAGGFWVSEPACVPLVVRAAQREQQVRIGVGAACPGQAPPPW
jgi:hypothetical protein